jgi:release factor glutamine methyltransferase
VSDTEPAAPVHRGPWTILAVLRWTAARFTERGVPTPRLDAELLAAHAFGLSRVQLYTQFDRPLEAAELSTFRALVKRRQAGEPVAYLTGHKEFWSLDLAVGPQVLVPRPDTETLIEEALARLPPGRPARVADVGTGSGAIALALARERPEISVFASDLSAKALAVAQGNAERLGLAVTFVEGDLLAPLFPHGPFDLVAANLPYVPTAEIPNLAPEVRAEPLEALDGGPDGLDLLRRLITGVSSVLLPGGSVVLEVGAGQAPATVAYCARAGLVEVCTRRDLAGIERVVAARVTPKT